MKKTAATNHTITTTAPQGSPAEGQKAPLGGVGQGPEGHRWESRMCAVWSIIEKSELDRPLWVRVGTGFVNRDASINIYLDAMPTNARLHIRALQPTTSSAAAAPAAVAISAATKKAWAIVETDNLERPKWVDLGRAKVSRDGSIDVTLFALPINGRIHLRDTEPNT